LKLTFHHVGVVTRDLRASTMVYEGLGYRASAVIDDPVQGVAIVLCTRAAEPSEPIIELISPSHGASPAAGWLARIKAGPYHTCYVVNDLTHAIAELGELGLSSLSEPVPAVAFGGRRIVFLWGRDTGLIELLESREGLST
jgi:methylmalonyl-CoA/ethylmalonyl-CoA epimerase